MLKIKYKKQNKKINNKTKVVVGVYLSRKKNKKRTGYIIPTMNCYPRNGSLRDPDFTRHKLYHPNQYQYLQHLILWVVLNVSKTVLRIRLTRMQSQHSIK